MEERKNSTTTQYLTFTLDQELFALDIDKVREVLDCTTVTKVPQMPDYMCGVINLRGSVVPVVQDLLRKRITDAGDFGCTWIKSIPSQQSRLYSYFGTINSGGKEYELV